MEINSKQLMIAAAIGAAAWYFLRKKPAASSGTGGANAVTSAINSLGGLFGGGNTKPLSVDIGQTKPMIAPETGVNKPMPVAPAAAPAVWGAPVSGASPPITQAVFGGGGSGPTPPAPPPGGASFGGGPATPAPAPGGGTFGHLTTEQRGGKTDGQLALSILGY